MASRHLGIGSCTISITLARCPRWTNGTNISWVVDWPRGVLTPADLFLELGSPEPGVLRMMDNLELRRLASRRSSSLVAVATSSSVA